MTIGRFWSRPYTTSFDLFEGELVDGPVNTVLRAAFVDVCAMVEDVDPGGRPGSLASVSISLTEGGDYVFEAILGDRSHVIVTQRCHKCSVSVYGGFHPFNGCSEVILEEVMCS